jgi:hypothetical protein
MRTVFVDCENYNESKLTCSGAAFWMCRCVFVFGFDLRLHVRRQAYYVEGTARRTLNKFKREDIMRVMLPNKMEQNRWQTASRNLRPN